MRIRTTRKIMDETAAGIDSSARFSAYSDVKGQGDVDWQNEIVEYDEFDATAFQGVTVFEHEGYYSEPIEDPTYADMFSAFAQIQRQRNDEHHVFFEGWAEVEKVAEVQIIKIHSGS